ncbi:MAG: carbon storage regulator [Deltaproteobacteria bacterium]|nr:carbon storage regulator [Deltaproteobacteria bacterium]
MLVLTRKCDQKIRIGESISVTVLAVERDQVRIGISAPRDIAIHREEVFEEIQAANRAAAVTERPDLGSLRAELPERSPARPKVDPAPE